MPDDVKLCTDCKHFTPGRTSVVAGMAIPASCEHPRNLSVVDETCLHTPFELRYGSTEIFGSLPFCGIEGSWWESDDDTNPS